MAVRTILFLHAEPWLGKVFPEVLGRANISLRGRRCSFLVFPAGETRFAPPALPTWLFQEDLFYGMPDLESRGLKIAYDGHGRTR